MHFHRLDLNLLVALDALLVERSITQAGQRVHLTQSAMSGALARLRDYFGDELLVPVGRKMVPTPLAKALAEPVHDILVKIKSTTEARPGFDPASSRRRFSLMMSDYVLTVLMPTLLQRVQPIAPHVQFEFLTNNIENPLEALDRADVDVLIMPDRYLPDSHPKEALFQDEYVCVVAADNPLVRDRLSLDQYLSIGHVLVEFSSRRMPTLDEWFTFRMGHERRVEVSTMSLSSVPALIVGTTRIATIQKLLVKALSPQLPLRVIEPPLELPALIESMQWHTHFDQDPGTQWLRGVLKQIAHELGASVRSNAP
jgi:DNA-binding transcriptional LysR family regulator